jgi:hypothetical protein
MTPYEIISLVLESLVVVILIVEFIYDFRLNQHVKSLKRRTKRRFEFDSLTTGEHK